MRLNKIFNRLPLSPEVGYIFLGNFAQKVLWLIAIPKISANSSLSTYGKFEFILTSISLVSLAILFGSDSYMARKWHEQSNQLNLLRQGLILIGGASLLLFAIFIVLLSHLPLAKDCFLIGSVSLALAVYSLVNMFLRMSRQYHFYSLALLTPIVFLSIGIFVKGARSAEHLVYCLGAGYLFSASLGLLVVLNQDKECLSGNNEHSLAEFIKFCMPLVPSLFFGAMLNQSERYIIEDLLGLDILGIYSVAFRYAAICGFGVTVFRQVWLPQSMNYITLNDFTWFSKLAKSYIWIGALLAACLGLSSDLFFKVAGLKEISGTGYTTFLLAACALAYGSSCFTGLFCLQSGKTGLLSLVTLFGLVTSAASSYVVITNFGQKGIGLGTLLGCIVYSSGLLIACKRTSEFFYFTKHLCLAILSGIFILKIKEFLLY